MSVVLGESEEWSNRGFDWVDLVDHDLRVTFLTPQSPDAYIPCALLSQSILARLFLDRLIALAMFVLFQRKGDQD